MAALELGKAAKKCLSKFFWKLKKNACFWRNVMESTGFFCKIVILAEDYGWMTELFCRICENGVADL